MSHNQQQPFSGLHQPGRPINYKQLTLKMTSTLVVETSVTINNSPSQDYTNPDDQPTTNIDSDDDFHTDCSDVSHNQQQSFSVLHKPGRPINYKQLTLKMTSTLVVETSVTTNNSPSQDYTNPDDQPTTNIDSDDDFHTGCRNVSHNQQQPFSGVHKPVRSTNYKH